MIVLLLRVLLTAVFVVAPFLLAALATSKAQGLIWLMLPIVAAIPILLIVVLVFVPAEYMASALGLSANLVIPIVGALVGAVVVVGAIFSSRNMQASLEKIWAGGASTIGALIGVIVGGILLGVAWRAAAWTITRLGWN